MRSLCLTTLLVLFVAASAYADPTMLSGGVLLTHYVEDMTYSSDPPALGWCGEYSANHAITTLGETVCRIDVPGDYLPCCWFVLAAWEEEKIWCGTEFGFDDYDPAIFTYVEYGPCYPPDGGLEIPSPGWPGPNEGTAFVVTGAPWEGNYVPVMFFGGYAYSYASPGIIPVAEDPVTGFVGFSNCDAPPEPYSCQALGALGINMDGICFHDPPPGACCFSDGHCEFVEESQCFALGGHMWLGAFIPCDPNPCPPPGACCFLDGHCEILTEEECNAGGNRWLGPYTICVPNPCCPGGACCLPEPPNACEVMWEDDCYLFGGIFLGPGTDCGPPNPCEVWPIVCCLPGNECVLGLPEPECLSQGGTYHPEWTTCEPNPCVPTPVKNGSWGRIKSIYR